VCSCFICDLVIYWFVFLCITAGDGYKFPTTETPEFSKNCHAVDNIVGYIIATAVVTAVAINVMKVVLRYAV